MKNRLSGLSLLLLGFCHSPVWAEDLGATIFQQGIGRDGREVIASLPGQVSLQGASVACAGCHGQTGQGGKEGFVSAPAISWQALAMRSNQRKVNNNSGYDKSVLQRAISHGLAADGRPLDPIMPRFSLASDELDALVAYLQHLDQQASPKLAVALSILPEAGVSKLADALLDNLQTCSGLSPGTRLWPLQVLRYKNPADAISQLRERLKVGSVRFLLAPFVAGWEADYGELMEEYRLATLLPFSRMDLTDQQPVFLALPGLQKQLRALIDLAVTRNIKQLHVLSAADDLSADSLIESVRPYAAKQHVELQIATPALNPPQKNSVWLIVSPLNLIAPQLKAQAVEPDSLALIPAPYFSPDLAATVSNWLIAYPYPPQNPADKNWQSPLARWSQAGCNILAKAAEQPDTAWWQDNRASAEFDTLIPKRAVILPWSTQ
jgi:mono/diheme cytochrome c family protein